MRFAAVPFSLAFGFTVIIAALPLSSAEEVRSGEVATETDSKSGESSIAPEYSALPGASLEATLGHPHPQEISPWVRPEEVLNVPIPASTEFQGEIKLVRRRERFVVVEFQADKTPSDFARLGVYREGKIVGVVKITPPTKPPLVTADILDGMLEKGDAVR